MARGAPDDSNIVKFGDTHRVDDMAELAARLGSVLTFRRAGEVLTIEDFGGGLGGWYMTATDPTGTFYLSNDAFLSAGVGLQIAQDAAATEYCSVYNYNPVIVAGKVGFQGNIAVVLKPKYVSWAFWFYDSGGGARFTFRYDFDGKVVAYRNSGGGYTQIADNIDLRSYLHLFHSYKLVVDLEQREYVRVCLNQDEYSLAGISGHLQAATSYTQLVAIFSVESSAARDVRVYVDNFVLTRNEI